MTDSSMLIGTQARTMPGITLSNYTPLTKFGFQYEVFMAEMSRIDDIAFEGGTTSGKPRLAGLQVSIEPVRGWSLSAESRPAVRRRRARRVSERLVQCVFQAHELRQQQRRCSAIRRPR